MGRTEIKKNKTGKGKGKSLAALKRKKLFGGGGSGMIGSKGGSTPFGRYTSPSATPQGNRGTGSIDNVGPQINVPFGGGSNLIGSFGSIENMMARLTPKQRKDLEATKEKFSNMSKAEMRQLYTDSVAKREKDKRDAALERKQFMGGGINIDIGDFAPKLPQPLKNQAANPAKVPKLEQATSYQPEMDMAVRNLLNQTKPTMAAMGGEGGAGNVSTSAEGRDARARDAAKAARKAAREKAARKAAREAAREQAAKDAEKAARDAEAAKDLENTSETTGGEGGAGNPDVGSIEVEVGEGIGTKQDAPKVTINPGESFTPEAVKVEQVDIEAGVSTDPAVQIREFNNLETKKVDAPTTLAPTDVDVDTADTPENIVTSTMTADKAVDLEATKAAQGTVSDEAIARADGPTLTERAEAATRDTAQEKEALADTVDFNIADGAYVDKVTGKTSDVAPTPEAEAAQREAITGVKADDGESAKIVDTVGYEAAKRRTVKGEAAKSAAIEMLAEVGELPPAITAAIVEDPATMTAALDEEPVEVRAAIAALPTEALVSSQMESLLAGMDEGKTPAWARPAVAAIEANLAKRGLSASTVGRDALFNAIITSAMPMAQSNAQALQQRAAQNLGNEQQANMQQSTLDMQRRMANLSNRQQASSQSATMAQQMNMMQSQFKQDAVMTTAQMQQQTRTQNLSNQQQAAVVNAQNSQASNAQNLGNEQQIELANLQIADSTERENMSAENQERLVEMQTAADFLSKNAGFQQQMNLANLSNDQQMKLANLSALNQASSENLSARQQTELANLNTTMQTNLTSAKIAAEMNQAQLNVDQQRAVQNAAMVANVDLTKFSAGQQTELANSKFMQSMTVSDFNAEQQAAMQNATMMAQMDLASADQRTKLAITNAQSFLQMDMANLSNNQQATVLDQQMKQQRILSDQSATNAAKQFNAASENQTNQFMASMAANMNQFNSAQTNAMGQFNASEKNKADAINSNNELEVSKANAQMDNQMAQFNQNVDFQREQWNSANQQAVEQSNVEWRRQANTINTAAANAGNQANAQMAFNLSSAEQSFVWQNLRDEAAYVRTSFENDQQRKTVLFSTALQNESGAGAGGSSTDTLMRLAGNIFN